MSEQNTDNLSVIYITGTKEKCSAKGWKFSGSSGEAIDRAAIENESFDEVVNHVKAAGIRYGRHLFIVVNAELMEEGGVKLGDLVHGNKDKNTEVHLLTYIQFVLFLEMTDGEGKKKEESKDEYQITTVGGEYKCFRSEKESMKYQYKCTNENKDFEVSHVDSEIDRLNKEWKRLRRYKELGLTLTKYQEKAGAQDNAVKV